MRDDTAASRLGLTSQRLPLPAAVDRTRIVWSYAITVGLYHIVALLAVLPWFFSWTGLILGALGIFVFGSLGINLGYHRLLTHHGLVCPKWLEHGFAILGICCMQDTPARWVAVHRRHHQFSDRQDDPHTPLVNFLWGHVGWMLVENRDLARLGIYDRYAKDILRDPFYRRLERSFLYPTIIIGSWATFFLLGAAIGLILGYEPPEIVQLGASVLLWGVFVRTVAVWHITWLVNSAAHLWGHRPYDTGDDSRNNWVVALLSNGEGWHNNHHIDPRSAAHGRTKWQIDGVFACIRALEALGLATDVVRPNPNLPVRPAAESRKR